MLDVWEIGREARWRMEREVRRMVCAAGPQGGKEGERRTVRGTNGIQVSQTPDYLSQNAPRQKQTVGQPLTSLPSAKNTSHTLNNV
jgi:hypothetical protein